MNKMKRAVAFALAATLAMGSTFTAFAADGTTGGGDTTGQGQNEGHVEKELINVVIPTMPETGSPFDYVTDPERLIQATAGAKYEDYTFPKADEDTGVYFLVGEKEYANTSSTLEVINKSSCNVAITVTAQAKAVGATDLELAEDSNTTAAKPLFLNLKVGQENKAISKDSVSVKKVIAGNPENFEVKYTGEAYEYVQKSKAYSWKAIDISMNGAVYEGAVQAATTAPTVAVTWAFEKAGDSDSVDDSDQLDFEDTGAPGIISISDYVKEDPKDVVIKFDTGLGAQELNVNSVTVNQGAAKTALGKAKYTVDLPNGIVTIDGTAPFLANAKGNVPIQLVLMKGTKTLKKLNGTITVMDEYGAVGPKIVSITEFNKKAPKPVVITFSLGTKELAVDADSVTVTYSAAKTAVATSKLTVDMAGNTVTIDNSAGWLTNATADIPVYLTFTKDGSPVSEELAGTIVVLK